MDDDPVSAHYRLCAIEVDELAKTAISESHRRELLQIAAKWRELAAERDLFNKRWDRATQIIASN